MTLPAPAARRPSAALLWVLLAAMGAGPLFNYGVSASSTVVMERLDVTSGQLGTVMTVVFAAAAVTSLGLGRAADRLSARAQLSIIFGGTAAALVLGAVVAVVNTTSPTASWLMRLMFSRSRSVELSSAAE